MSLIIVILSLAVVLKAEAQLVQETGSDGSGVYGTVGVGIANIDRGPGIGVPLGVTMLNERYRLIFSGSFLDLIFMQKEGDNPRYQRIPTRDPRYNACWDNQRQMTVSSYLCSGGTDVLRSFSVDVSFIPVETVIVADRPGKLYTGLGFRALKPRTPYGTIGMFIDSPSGRAGGVRVNIGRDFLYLGLTWGIHVDNVLRRW
tara:strand:+ start:2515 stop:3117 length:603 start_codon:yes stop_codon:yes gene_type:complete